MLSAWAILLHVATLLLCANVLLLKHFKWRSRIIAGGVGLHSLIQVGGLGAWLAEAIDGSDLVTAALCVVMIFLIREAVVQGKSASPRLRLAEFGTQYPWELVTPDVRPAPCVREQPNPADRRTSARRTIRVCATLHLMNEPRVNIEGVTDDIGLKGMRLRLTEAVPLSSPVRVCALGDTFLGVIRYCDAAPDYREFYTGIEFDHQLDSTVLDKYLAIPDQIR